MLNLIVRLNLWIMMMHLFVQGDLPR